MDCSSSNIAAASVIVPQSLLPPYSANHRNGLPRTTHVIVKSSHKNSNNSSTNSPPEEESSKVASTNCIHHITKHLYLFIYSLKIECRRKPSFRGVSVWVVCVQLHFWLHPTQQPLLINLLDAETVGEAVTSFVSSLFFLFSSLLFSSFYLINYTGLVSFTPSPFLPL
jgi:hypothetical protein